MNGIIHVCSHPDDTNVQFRISEEQIFKDVFFYIEVLFRLIQPQKLMFMAIDGVAPRAKMNQQRGRRFVYIFFLFHNKMIFIIFFFVQKKFSYCKGGRTSRG